MGLKETYKKSKEKIEDWKQQHKINLRNKQRDQLRGREYDPSEYD